MALSGRLDDKVVLLYISILELHAASHQFVRARVRKNSVIPYLLLVFALQNYLGIP